MGASLGALAMLHAHVATRSRSTGCCSSRAASSASAPTSRSRASLATARITRFIGTVLRGVDVERTIPIAITCGTGEENNANNRALADALVEQGYPAWLAEIRDGHTWTCWRDSFDPHLPALIEAVA